jgi:RNA polymerase sigma-70 factor (ECF subfamily)
MSRLFLAVADQNDDPGVAVVPDIEALYRTHRPAVYRFALALSGNAADAEDITAETFLRVWTARDRLDLSTVIGYLLTIARHLYLQGVRHAARRESLEQDVVDPVPSVAVQSAARDALAAALADLQTLPEMDRAAVLMRAQEHLQYDEIAAALRITPGAAKVKVHRARQRLWTLRQAREGYTR